MWKGITSDQVILNWLQGYKIPFATKVRQVYAPKEPKVSKEEFEFLSKEVAKLLDKGAISKCQYRKGQFISLYFLVDKPNGEKRFILNLKNLNKFIIAPHFKMEDRKTATRLMHERCFMACLDLKDAYFLVPVHQEHRKYLRFSFNGNLYEFTCLPFGLCTAPFVFTKLTKPVVHKLRSQGHISVIYLDDLLLIGRSQEECIANIQETRSLLESLGFILNLEKCQLRPSTTCKFLGFMLNSAEMQVELTDKKRQTILRLAQKFKNQKQCKIRDLARFLGILVAACPAVKYGPLYTKRLERQKFLALERSHDNFDQSMELPNSLNEDLDWWIQKIPSIVNPIRKNNFKFEIFSDASLTGWGVFSDGNKSHGWWNTQEKKEHINLLELKAAFYGLKCFASEVRSYELLLRIDNTTAISYVNRMGSVQFPKLSELCRQIWEWCEARDLWVFASYVKSKENVHADAESRTISADTEWELNDHAFSRIEKALGNLI